MSFEIAFLLCSSRMNAYGVEIKYMKSDVRCN